MYTDEQIRGFSDLELSEKLHEIDVAISRCIVLDAPKDRVRDLTAIAAELTVEKNRREASSHRPEAGRKFDLGKWRFSLLPIASILEVINVLEFGAKKYEVDNWKKVPEARERYFDATMRHIVSWYQGERNDPETGYNHLAHAVCCLLFLIWFDKQEKE
ncbi:hypothetical protein MIF8_75 [Erwinia phage MIF8]